MASLWAKYLKALDTNPITTKSLTAGVLLAGGDGIAQLFIEKRKNYDFMRTARFATFGTFALGPMMHYWFASPSSTRKIN